MIYDDSAYDDCTMYAVNFRMLCEELLELRDKGEPKFTGAMAEFTTALVDGLRNREAAQAERDSISEVLRRADIDPEHGFQWTWKETVRKVHGYLLDSGWTRQ